MRYIIMAGGKYDGWQKPRQLIEVNGEPVIMRTIRLLRAAGVDDIAISTDDKGFKLCGVPLLEHDNNFEADHGKVTGLWTDAFYPCADPACYIFGDVVFSPEAIKTIVETDTKDINFFASSPPFADDYIKKHAEPFAFKVVNQKWFRQAIKIVKWFEQAGMFSRPPIAWELWQIIRGKSINDIDFDSYIAINDYTCDIDKYEDALKMGEILHEREGNNSRV